MEKILYYGMTGEKMCFQHVLMNALDMSSNGHEIKIIFEGASVKLVAIFEEEQNKLYLTAKEKGLIAGVCLACSNVLGVYESIKDCGLEFINDMNGHAGMKKFIEAGYKVVSM